MKINKKITDVNIEVGDTIYQSISGLCIWGNDSDVQNGVSINLIPNCRMYENVLVPLKYLGNNIFEEELTHNHILCLRSETISPDDAICTMDSYEEKIVSCDLDFESYISNEHIHSEQKNAIDYGERLKKVSEYCNKYPVAFCIDTSTIGPTYIIDSESQKEYDRVSIQEKIEILANIYRIAKECASNTLACVDDSIKKEENNFKLR